MSLNYFKNLFCSVTKKNELKCSQSVCQSISESHPLRYTRLENTEGGSWLNFG